MANASSGVAASLLPGGRTAYSHFKIPINIEGKFSGNISKQSSLASLIRDAKLIVWDEISMEKWSSWSSWLTFEIFNGNKNTIGRKVIVFSDDFRQTLPVVRKEKTLFINVYYALKFEINLKITVGRKYV